MHIQITAFECCPSNYLLYLLSVCHWQVNKDVVQMNCLSYLPQYCGHNTIINHQAMTSEYNMLLWMVKSYIWYTWQKKYLPSPTTNAIWLCDKKHCCIDVCHSQYINMKSFFHSMYATFTVTTVAAINSNMQIFFCFKTPFILQHRTSKLKRCHMVAKLIMDVIHSADMAGQTLYIL